MAAASGKKKKKNARLPLACAGGRGVAVGQPCFELAAAAGRAGLRVQRCRQVIIRSGALQENKKEPGRR